MNSDVHIDLKKNPRLGMGFSMRPKRLIREDW
jgi:hypothetical protein